MNVFMNLITLMISLSSVGAAVTRPSTVAFDLIAPYNGCLRPLSADRSLFNEVTNSLQFAFVQVTITEPVAPGTPATITELGTPIGGGVLSIYDNARGDCNQREIYITINPENAVPPIVPTTGLGTAYALQITGIPVGLFQKFVELFTIYLIRNDIDPAFVIAQWGVPLAGPIAPFIPSLFLIFQSGTTPASYDFAGQMIIIAFNAVATSATYTDTTGFNAAGILAETITVTVTSEIFTSNTQTFVGTLLPVVFDLMPFHRFVPYWGYPSQQKIALTRIDKLIREYSHTKGISPNDFNAMSHISSIFTSRCCIMKRCCKTKYESKCCKSTLIKYFAFVSCSLRCLPKFECCPEYVCELDKACRSSKDCVSVFAALLLKICVGLKIDASYCAQTIFDSVIGYNPYCSPTACPAVLYRFCSRDAELVTRSSVCAEVEVVAIEEEHIPNYDDECVFREEPRKRVPKCRDSFASRYKWHITVSVVVVVVASASAYALAM